MVSFGILRGSLWRTPLAERTYKQPPKKHFYLGEILQGVLYRFKIFRPVTRSSPSAWKEIEIVTFLELIREAARRFLMLRFPKLSFLVTDKIVNCHIRVAYSRIFHGKFVGRFSIWGMLAATRARRWYQLSIRQKRDISLFGILLTYLDEL